MLELEICRHTDNIFSDSLIDAVVDGKKIVFDLQDGYYYNDLDAVKKYFNDAFIIFKRSYSREQNILFSSDIQAKLKPFGFNLFVTDRTNPLTPEDKSVKAVIKALKLTNSYVSDFEVPALKPVKNPKILFLTRLWDPASESIRGNKALISERETINKVRTDTIRILKKEFPKSFFGGVYQDDFSLKYCPDLIVPKIVSLKRFYLRRMQKSDICVNTMGLHGSVGWKTGEYISSCRAIVSEKFLYATIGDFKDGKNYLSFTTAEECVAKIKYLAENPSARAEMSKQNKLYYNSFLRPDSLIRYALSFLEE